MFSKVILFIAYCLPIVVVAQQHIDSLPINISEIQEGEKMPDVPLGEYFGQPYPFRKISDLKGKLIILEFWDSYCGSCIEDFPKMVRLQQLFGDKVQIILVNTSETHDQLRARIAAARFLLPELPILINATHFAKMFPRRFAGATVWIDKEGTVIARAASSNNHYRKLHDYFEGKRVIFTHDGKDYEGQRYGAGPMPMLSGTWYPYSDTFSLIDAHGLQVRDSGTGTLRNTWVNTNILHLLLTAYESELREQTSQRIKGLTRGGSGLDFVHLRVPDTLVYTDDFSYLYPGMRDSLGTDDNNKAGTFIYEQIFPETTPESVQKALMKKDIDGLLISTYQSTAALRTIMQPCYQVIRTDTTQPLNRPVKQARKKNVWQYEGKNVAAALPLLFIEFAPNMLVMDATGYTGEVSLEMPHYSQIKSIAMIRKSLQRYGMDLIFGKLPIQKICIE